MKTRILVILALITLNVSFVFADNNNTNRKGFEGPSVTEFSAPVTVLAPVTPMEATFEDTPEVNHLLQPVSSLAPSTPKEATFEEISALDESTFEGTVQSNRNSEINKKGQHVHPDFPLPCDAKYGCGL
ncbi:MAG: hypothetical protein NTW10_04690 [Bacteroidetes bacterium]|nr:hypothetical protein [Bacteroidota bacterium]